MAELLMPKLSDTMEEGTILRWMKGDGETVAKGEPLLEVETDKANMVVEAPEDGVLHVVAEEGATLPVGARIAAIGDGVPDGGASPDEHVALATGATSEEGPEEPTNIPVSDDGTGGEIGMEIGVGETYPEAERLGADDDETEEALPAVAAPPDEAAQDRANGRVKASPLARSLARELGVDLTTVRGTGPGGRIVRADVEAAGRAGAVSAAPEARERAGAPAPSPAPAGERVPLSRLRRTIARRMAESWAHAPHFFLQRDVDATDLLDLRGRLVEAAPEGEGPTVNDLIVRALAMACAEHPEWLRQYADDSLVQASGVHVGVAVATDRGLLVPVVRDADRRSVGDIARVTRDLIARAREGRAEAAELEGSTISVSNLGMLGIDRFTAVINPPEPAILAVGRAAPRPVARDGAVVVRDVMTLTLSLDHRALDGAAGARLLGRVAELLERPHALLL